MPNAENAGFDPTPGVCEWLTPRLRRVLAANPSPMTFRGTNSYLLGRGAVAVIDPGPADPAHLAALQAALGPDEHVAAILVTHSHRDHSQLAPALAAASGAAIHGFGPAQAGRSPQMQALCRAGQLRGGEGVDAGFVPDVTLADGARLQFGDLQVEALWTPGHMSNHLCFASEGQMFCGDLVMGWASTVVSPPDGDLAAFYNSCARLRARPETVFHPGHGAPITQPRACIDRLVQHRKSREAQILAALEHQSATVSALTRRIYRDVDPGLLPAAGRNVLAHLVELCARDAVRADPHLSAEAVFTRTK